MTGSRPSQEDFTDPLRCTSAAGDGDDKDEDAAPFSASAAASVSAAASRRVSASGLGGAHQAAGAVSEPYPEGAARLLGDDPSSSSSHRRTGGPASSSGSETLEATAARLINLRALQVCACARVCGQRVV